VPWSICLSPLLIARAAASCAEKRMLATLGWAIVEHADASPSAPLVSTPAWIVAVPSRHGSRLRANARATASSRSAACRPCAVRLHTRQTASN